jgi:ABC-2 type transport system permease protein
VNTLIRTEILKLRTVRGPWLILAAAPLLVLAGVSGLVISGGDLHKPAAQSGALAHVGLTSLFTLVFGILAVAGEYRHKTITDTYLSTPERRQVITAKIAVYTSLGALSGVACSAAGLAAAAAWWADKGMPFSWPDSAMWTTIGGSIAWNAAFAAIGVGLGALVRNLVGAIAVALAWIAVIEGIVGQLVGSLARWLPFNAGQALGGSAGGSGGGPPGLGSATLLPRWGGAVVLVAYTIAFAVAAVTTSIRRDVA